MGELIITTERAGYRLALPTGEQVALVVNGRPVKTFREGWRAEGLAPLGPHAYALHLVHDASDRYVAWIVEGSGRHIGAVSHDIRGEVVSLDQRARSGDRMPFVALGTIWADLTGEGARPLTRDGAMFTPGRLERRFVVEPLGMTFFLITIGLRKDADRTIIVDSRMRYLGDTLDDLEAATAARVWEQVHAQLRTIGRVAGKAPDRSALMAEAAGAIARQDQRIAEDLARLDADPAAFAAKAEALEAAGFNADRFRQANPHLGITEAPLSAHQVFLAAREVVPVAADNGREAASFDRLEPLDRAFADTPALRRRVLARAGRAQMTAMLAASGEAGRPLVNGQVEQAPDSYLEAVISGAGAIGGKPVLIIGDSHSYLYSARDVAGDGAWPTDLWMFCPGGTAAGLANRNSRLRYGSRIRRMIARLGEIPGGATLPIMLKFGQVDLEFTYQHKRIQADLRRFDRAHFDVFVDSVVERYLAYLTGLFPEDDRARVNVCSVFPPVLSDESWATGYLNANRTIEHDLTAEQARSLMEDVKTLDIPTLAERAGLHRDFNARLRAATTAAGFSFANDFELYVSGAGDRVDDYFAGAKQGRDWHVDRLRARDAAASVLSVVLSDGRA